MKSSTEMAGRPWLVLSLAVVLTACGINGGETMHGKDLVGTNWWVEDLLGGGVIDRSHTTIHFVEAGRVAGDGGCNRYMGSYESDGASLSFGPLAGTLKACPEALMNQERRFHQAMDRVRSWRIDARTRLLHLEDESGETVIRAWKIEEGQEMAE